MLRSISWCLSSFVVIALFSLNIGLLPGNGTRSDGAEAELPAEEIIRRGLDKPVTLEAEETPFGDAMKHLAKQAGLPNVQIDTRALEDVGIGTDMPITWNLKGISLRNALRLVLRDLDLTFVIRDEVLLITTPEEAESRLVTQIIDVLDLVRIHDDTTPEEYDYDTLIELITSIVAPTTWDDAGGPGAIGGFRGTLVISQTLDVLDEYSPLLDTVRKARQIVREHGKQTPPITSLLASPPRVEAIDRGLLQKVTCDFHETPLLDVVAFLQKTCQIPIRIDNRSLEDIGVGSDTPVTFSATDLTLGHALRHILKQLDLAYVQRCSVLLITTPEEAEALLETRVYPVGDLLSGVAAAPAGGSADFEYGDYDTLIELTTATVTPVTWADVGGYGSIASLPAFGLCVVSQTEQVHQEIERLFAELRKKIPRENVAEEEENENGLRLVVYFVGTKSEAAPAAAPAAVPSVTPEVRKTPDGAHTTSGRPGGNRILAQLGAGSGAWMGGAGGPGSGLFEDKELLELLQELVEPDSWDSEGVYARAAAGRLIVRQTDDVHRKIRRLLGRLGVVFFDSAQNSQMMPGFWDGNMGGMGGGGMF